MNTNFTINPLNYDIHIARTNFNYREKQENVYVHSIPKNHELYDLIWKRQFEKQAIKKSWGIGRLTHLKQLVGIEHNFFNNRVLDLCCGLGRISAACLESGACEVVCADGSFNGPNSAYKIISQLDPSFVNRLIPVQVDVEKIDSCFDSSTFDVVVCYWSLHHTRDYKKTLYSIERLIKNGGIATFNFFTTGTTPKVCHDLRDIFLHESLETVDEFMIDLGIIDIDKKEFDLSDILSDNVPKKIFEKYSKIIQQIKPVIELHGINVVFSRIHLEDLQTPYINNLEHASVVDFITTKTALKILNGEPDGWITVVKKE